MLKFFAVEIGLRQTLQQIRGIVDYKNSADPLNQSGEPWADWNWAVLWNRNYLLRFRF